MSPIARTIAALLLFVLGLQLWLVVGRGQPGNLPGPIVWGAILLAALLPPVNRRVARALDWLARPSPRTRLMVTALVAIAAGSYLYFTAVRQGRDFFPKIHDEFSYAIQAQMLAAGRLWMAAHPAADSFDAPYVLVRPVYASMYFPGTALTLVPAVWVGLPWWVTPLVLSAAAAGVLYRVVGELVDGVAGLLAALMLASLSIFRELSLRLYSQVPMLLLALCLVWAWLAWRRDRSWVRALLIGAIAGWMLIVRPLDAIVFLVPIAVAMALELRRFDRRTVIGIVAGVMPFVALQLVANRGITGSWFTTPHASYAQRDFPGVTLGFHQPRPPSTLATVVPQKRVLYEKTIPAIEKHQPGNVAAELIRNRLPLTVATTLPNPMLMILLPLGVAVLFEPRRRQGHQWVMAAPLLLFALAYALYLFYFAHYLLVVAPAMIFLIVLAARELPELWTRARPALVVFITFAITAISLYALPELDRTVYDEVGAGDLGAINRLLSNLPHRPAIVLFRFREGASVQREPVYNIDAANIDEAEIIRAHDLPGEANEKLFEYYAARQPQRHVYRVDRAAGPGSEPTITYLGPVSAVRQAARQPL